MLINDQGRPDLSSRKEDLVKNSDGSVDVYFGPEAPEGKEANWVQTVPGQGVVCVLPFLWSGRAVL
jgi:hypothetical protein